VKAEHYLEGTRQNYTRAAALLEKRR